jgi:hypothetical protein
MKPWQLKPSFRSDERLRLWLSAMPGSRCVTRFLHTKLSPPRKMLLKRFRGLADSVCVRARCVPAIRQNAWTARAESGRGYCMARIV